MAAAELVGAGSEWRWSLEGGGSCPLQPQACLAATSSLPILQNRRYDAGSRSYDAFFLHTLPDLANMTAGGGGDDPGLRALPAYDQHQQHQVQYEGALAEEQQLLQYSVLSNQTAIHGLPAALTQLHSALLRWVTGDSGAELRLTAWPLPVLPREEEQRVTEAAGTVLVLSSFGWS